MPFALRPGTMITGYEVVRAIGAGGFGITYEGYNPITERRVAIKEFFPRGIASRDDATRIAYSKQDNEVVEWALKRFAESTNRLAKLKHPHIIEVLNYVADNGTGYMVMEHVDGITLEEWLRSLATPPQLAELGPIFDPIFDALEYVHSMNLIHRDIAPDNIMIRKDDGQPVLIDFGALKIIEQHTRAHGTAPKSFGVMKQNYSPPEQGEEGGPADPRVDVYSLAATIYRAIAGKPPVDADKRKTDLALRGVDSYVPVAQAAQTSVPKEFADTLDAALSLRPEGRPATIAELRQRLAARSTDMAPTAIQTGDNTVLTTANAGVEPVQQSAPPAYVPAGSSAGQAGYVSQSVPPAYASSGSDAGQAGYIPPGGETPTVRRSGMAIPGIIGIVLVALLALGVLLHRPILTLVDRMAGTKIVTEDVNTPVQPQQKQSQKQTPQQQTQKQTPQQQTQKQQTQRTTPNAAYDRGVRLQQEGDNRRAIDEFTGVLRADPNNAEAYAARGLSHYQLGDRDLAYDDYTKSLRIDSDSTRAAIPYLNRAVVLRERGDADRGLLDVNNAIRLDPKLARAFNTRGNLNYDRRDYDAALNDYNEAIKLDPSYAIGYANRGNLYQQRRDHRRAIEDYSTSLRLDPKNAAALVGRGNAYDAQGDADRAIKDYTDAIRIDGGYTLAFVNRGRVYLNRNDHISALADFSDAVRLDARRATAHQGRGLANEGLGRRKEAVEDLRKALDIDSNLPRSRDALLRLGAR